jgi:hypothetical protein
VLATTKDELKSDASEAPDVDPSKFHASTRSAWALSPHAKKPAVSKTISFFILFSRLLNTFLTKCFCDDQAKKREEPVLPPPPVK